MNPGDAIAPYAGYFTRPAEEVLADLIGYETLLRKWQPVQNLVSRETLVELWTRHIADSLQLLKLIDSGARSFLDLGSGGGLPALPLAIALKGPRTFRLAEPNARKASFLRTVGRELDLAVEVLSMRAEAIDSRETESPDVITSRALAALPELFSIAVHFFGPDTKGLFHKGREYGEEIEQARSKWSFDVVILPSDTSPGAALLEISNLRAKSGI